MTRTFVSEVLQETCDLNKIRAKSATKELIRRIIAEIKRDGHFNLQGFGTFRVAEMKAYDALNPRTLEKVKVKDRKTVRFKASPLLRKALVTPRPRGTGRRSTTKTARKSSRESLQADL
jgi:DNA-binding protein HU-beta